MNDEDMFIDVDGIRCLRYDTSALEGWLIMHSMRKVLCGGDDFPVKRGKMAIVASDPLMQKEIDFIEMMSATGGCPPVGVFMEQQGTIVGVVDFEVVKETCYPGWDGSPNPVVFSNPHWLKNGKLVPVQPDIFIDDDRRGHGGRRGSRIPGRRR